MQYFLVLLSSEDKQKKVQTSMKSDHLYFEHIRIYNILQVDVEITLLFFSLQQHQQIMLTQPTSRSDYKFTLQYQLLGNPNDFNEIFQKVARDFRFIHWLREETNIQSLMSCIVRRDKRGFRLLKHERRDLDQELNLLRILAKNQRVKKDKNLDEQLKDEKNYQKTLKTLQKFNRDVQKISNQLDKKINQILPDPNSQMFLRIEQLHMSYEVQQESSQNILVERYFYSISLQRQLLNRSQIIGDKEVTLKYLIFEPQHEEWQDFEIFLKSRVDKLQQSVREVYNIQHIPPGIQVLVIDFTIVDKRSFFKNLIKLADPQNKQICNEPFKNQYIVYDQYFEQGKTKLPFREDQRISNKQIREEHYSLAFQGGGAKGLAYIGAYKALKQNTAKYEHNGKIETKKVPITSIIGSSAGGMISLAISTGISYRQLKRICFRMKDIPKKDSFRQNGENPQNNNKQNQDELTTQDIFERMKAILLQYGILQEEIFDVLKKAIEQNLGKIQKQILQCLSAFMPSLGDIFKNKDQTFNLYGLLVKGALMKGEAIHDIGVQCLIRYFLKIYYENEEKQLHVLLDDVFSVYRDQDINHKNFNDINISSTIVDCLQSYHKNADRILNLKISDILENYEESCEIFISIINNLTVTIVENQQNNPKHQKYSEDIMKTVFQSFRCETLNKIFDLEGQKGSLWSLLFKLYKCSQEEELKEIKVQTNLLTTQNIKKSNQSCNWTIRKFVQQLMSVNYMRYFTDQTYFQHLQSKPILQGKKLSKFQLQLAQIIVQSFDIVLKQKKLPLQLQIFKKNKEIFRKTIQEITMLQYYMLNNVQLTCTSVDLDNKILRLFNKKTSPFLPVCKAVQMSGSFPGAFKAQKWDKKWGTYTIHYQNYKAEIKLTGHEFTDGGLLANFPLRYLDNKDKCQKYLSHIPNQKTIILGFGLDFIQQNYKPNMKQIEQVYKASIEKKESLQKMWNQFQKIDLKKIIFDIASKLLPLKKLAQLAFQSQNSKDELLDWTDISHSVLNQVPIIKFLLKLVNAYPNSDRNFNIQTFNNRVLHQHLYNQWRNKYEFYQVEQRKLDVARIKVIEMLKEMRIKQRKQKHSLKIKQEKLIEAYQQSEYQRLLKEEDKRNQESCYTLKFKQVILNKCEERKKDIDDRIYIKKQVLKKMINLQRKDFAYHDPWFEYHKNPQAEMIKKLINILMMLLRQCPSAIRSKLTQEYLQLKYPKGESSNEKFKNILDYDISQSEKRMVQYMYLKLITNGKSQSQKRWIAEKISGDSYQQLIQSMQGIEPSSSNQKNLQSVKQYTKRFQQRKQLRQIFNYENIKKMFNQIIMHTVLESPSMKRSKKLQKTVQKSGQKSWIQKGKGLLYKFKKKEETKKVQMELPWNQYFQKFVKKFTDETGQFNAVIYCNESFKQNYFVKNDDVKKQQFQEYQSNKNGNLTQKQIQEKLFQHFKQYQNEHKTLKNAYVFEAEIIFRLNKEAVDQILLKQLALRGIMYFHELKNSKTSKQLKDLLNETSPYQFLKLIRSVVSQRDPAKNTQKLQIRQRIQRQNALLTLFFGSERRNFKYFKRYIQKLKQQTKNKYKDTTTKIIHQLELIDKKIEGNIYLQSFFLRFVQVQALSFVIGNKIAAINRQRFDYAANDARQLMQKYSSFIKDFKFVLNCFKEINILLSYMSISDEIPQDGFKYPLNVKQNGHNYKKAQISYKKSQKSNTTPQITNLSKKFHHILYHILMDFVDLSKKLTIKPNNTINVTHIQEIFMIRYGLIKTTLNQVYFPLKYRQKYLICKQQNHKIDDKQKNQLKYLGYILSIFDKLTCNNISIPLFNIDWKLTIKAQKILKIVGNKVVLNHSSFAKQINFVFVNQQKNHKQHDKSSLNKFHLILEGVSSSNEFYCTILALAKEIVKDQYGRLLQKRIKTSQTLPSTNDVNNLDLTHPEESQFNQNDLNLQAISAVTSSNFHVMFGFLLATNMSLDKVKRQMYHLKSIAQQCESQRRIENYFDSYQWLNECTSQYKELLKYLQKQRLDFFSQFQNLKDKNYSNDSLQSGYDYLKTYFNHQTRSFVESYDKILQQVSEEVYYVDGNFRPVKKPKEICKRFAFNFIEQLQEKVQYKYEEINKQVFQKLKFMVKLIYQSFGSLIQGVLCSIVARYGSVNIDETNSKLITKGIIVKRLLTTFQLKQYITKKLNELNLSPSITLSKFYDSAPRAIFINMGVINMNHERLQFLNQTNTPFMPVWAAILAATTLPFLYNYFPARQQWYGVQQKSTFYSLIVQNFFRVNETKKQMTQYCSSNYISSLPLEILTNKNVLKQLDQKYSKKTYKKKQTINTQKVQSDIRTIYSVKNNLSNGNSKPLPYYELQQFALAFTDRDVNNFKSLKFAKFQITKKMIIPFIQHQIKSMFSFSKITDKLKHKTEKDVNYWVNNLQSISKIGNMSKTFSTLVNSNDNFVLHWYYDKLIKLPIKLDTLDFHRIVDKDVQQKHFIRVLSEKSKQTVERSYEITKSFSSYLSQDEKQKNENRYNVRMRFQMFQQKNPDNNFVTKFGKLTMVNHSKWNQNKFNNFIASYKVDNTRTFTQDFIKAKQSQIVWDIEDGSRLQIKFYFSSFPNQDTNSKEKQSKLQSNLQSPYISQQPSVLQTKSNSVHQYRLLKASRSQESLAKIYTSIRQNKQTQKYEGNLAKVYYTRLRIDFRQLLDSIYTNNSIFKPQDTFEFDIKFLQENLVQETIQLSVKKNSIFYQKCKKVHVKVFYVSLKEQLQKNLINIHVRNNPKQNKMESVYISEWTYPNIK